MLCVLSVSNHQTKFVSCHFLSERLELLVRNSGYEMILLNNAENILIKVKSLSIR